jgi:hypothetical protein
MKIVKKLFIIALLFTGILYIPVNAQKIPLVLKKDSVLSPVGSYNAAAETYKENRTTENRNKLVFMAISQIDFNFDRYIKNKRHHNAFFQTVLDILEVGAATAISISNGERAKSVIADALGFVQGSRVKINENLRLLEQQVLVNKMIENRSKALVIIYDNIDKSDAEYPFERAYIDILSYYEAGTTDSALSALSTDTGNSADKAQEKLREVQGNFSPELTQTDLDLATVSLTTLQRLGKEFSVEDTKAESLAALKKIVAELQNDEQLNKLIAGTTLATSNDGNEIIKELKSLRRIVTALVKPNLVRKINNAINKIGNE